MGNRLGEHRASERTGGELLQTRKPVLQVRPDHRLAVSPTPPPAVKPTACSRSATSALRRNCTCWPFSCSRRVQQPSWCVPALRTPPTAAQRAPARRQQLRFEWPVSFVLRSFLLPISYIPIMLAGGDFRCDRSHISSWCDSRCESVA